MSGEELCRELDVLIRNYIKKENLQINIIDETVVEAVNGHFPWRHYKHQDFKLTTESYKEDIGITISKGEDPFEGYCAPPLFSVSKPEDALKFFNYFVGNHQEFAYKFGEFHYFDEKILLDKVKKELELEINEIPQRLDLRNTIEE